MIQIRASEERGHFDRGWLNTFHTFSFADYYDPAFMGFRSLRVINEDFVQPNSGFPRHPHRDMEIVTYILEGALEHKDSMGNGSVIRPGEVQRMTAGTGVFHSEFNPSEKESVHLLQIWILPERKDLQPSYEQKSLREIDSENQLRLVGSRDGRDGSVTIHQDVNLYSAELEDGQSLEMKLRPNRFAWIQVAKGELRLNQSTALKAGDGAAVSDEQVLRFNALRNSEFLLFDLN